MTRRKAGSFCLWEGSGKKALLSGGGGGRVKKQ